MTTTQPKKKAAPKAATKKASPAKPAAKKAPARKGRDADLEYVPGVGTTLPAKKAAPKKAAAKKEPPTAMHREAPFGPNGGALYYNSAIDRWYAFARIVDADGTRRRKTVATRSRDDAHAALVVIRRDYTLAPS